ncbi:PI-PLC X domain-containing protein [Gossypium australe]|uniref:PI-PLC X domain-containing protein n=1 Tax=Gossypium australe TaxID=47621 RepID=A0A5B6X4B4_9ROSI|nr:PI-PLC X domain-containing protein [Gossypium australe]
MQQARLKLTQSGKSINVPNCIQQYKSWKYVKPCFDLIDDYKQAEDEDFKQQNFQWDEENALISILVIASLCFGFCSSLREGQICIADRYCDSGLHCETCLANGNVRPRCTRIQPLNPISKVQYYSFYPLFFFYMILHFVCIKVKGLPFNRYSWLTTHNSFARLGERSATGSLILAPTNQQDSITSQLNRQQHY